MDLTIFEKIYWLGATSEKGKTLYTRHSAPFLYAVAGGALMEMILQKNILWEGKKQLLGDIQNPPKNAILLNLWEYCTIPKKINWFWRTGKKQQTAQTVIDWLGVAISHETKLITKIINGLVEKNIIITEKKAFLGIFSYNTFPIVSDEIRQNYQEKLQKIVSGELEAGLEDFIILKIVNACKLYSLVFTPQFITLKIKIQQELIDKLKLWATQSSENEDIINILKQINLEKDLDDLTDALDNLSDAIDGIADAAGDASDGGSGDGGGE